MIEVRKTRIFEDWLVSLRGRQARMRIQARIDGLAFGNPGQHRALTGGVCEMKIDCGPGYRASHPSRRCMGRAAVRRRQGIAACGHQGGVGVGERVGGLTWH